MIYFNIFFISVYSSNMNEFDATDDCCNCFKRKLSRETAQIKIINSADEIEAVRDQLAIENVDIGFKLCAKCRRLVFFGTQKRAVEVDPSSSDQKIQNQQSSSQSSSEVRSSQSQGSNFEIIEKTPKKQKPTTELPLRRTFISHISCCICRNKKNLTLVPLNARLQCFKEMRIFIPDGNRVCSEHLIRKRFFEDDLKLITVYSHTSFLTADEICLFLNKMTDSSSKSFLDKIQSSELSEKQLLAFTSLTSDQLQELRKLLVSMRSSESRDVMQALVVCLFKLRTGSSNNFISSVFEIENEIKVSDFCESVINSFEKDILPKYFGVKSIKREDLIREHTSIFARKLFNITDQLVVIFDGTYVRHQKSKNNEYQRKSYSGQKKYPLLKPFTICTTDGWVVDVPGPFLATENDASIMKKVMDDPNGIRSIMRKGDVCIVDRGFRDVINYLKILGFRVLMPALKGNRSNLTATESNESRFVTKLRWVVEAVHGIIGKKYKLLHQQLDNKLIPKAAAYCKIACFLNNTFGKRLNSDKDEDGLQDIIIQRMLNRNQNENTLALEAETARWSRRPTTTSKITSEEITDFPELTERDLKIFFSGTYQLGQAVCYLAELMDDSNNINLEYIKLKPNIIKVLVRSRHINKKIYKCYIEYSPNSIGYGGILRHACDCANGLRTVGSCSHIAAVIY